MVADPGLAKQLYPTIPSRLKAAEIDGLFLFGCLFILITAYVLIGYKTPAIIVLCGAILLLYEPILVSWRSQTLGHRIMGFRIIDASTKRNLEFSKAFYRYLIKIVLGIFSFIRAVSDKRQRPFHETITGSVAVMSYIPISELDSLETAFDQQGAASSAGAPPSAKRRTIVTCLYLLAGYIVVSLLFALASPECFLDEHGAPKYCKDVETLAGAVLSVVLVLIIIAGLKSRLPGARPIRKTPGTRT